LAVDKILGCGAAVPAGDGDRAALGVDAVDQQQFVAAVRANLVAHAETVRVVHTEGLIDRRVCPGGVVDRIGVGQQGVFEPLVVGACRGPWRITEMIEQRRLIGRDDTDQIGDVLGDLRKGRACGIGCFTCKSHFLLLSFVCGCGWPLACAASALGGQGDLALQSQIVRHVPAVAGAGGEFGRLAKLRCRGRAR